MRYELLAPEEWPELESIFVENGSFLPSPTVAAIAVARHGKEIAGFHCLQPAMHVEPLWVRPEFRGKVQFRPLLGVLKRTMPGQQFYAFAPSETIEKICECCHLDKMPYSVWKGVA